MGGQPANFLDDCPVPGTGAYYYDDPRYVGLVFAPLPVPVCPGP